MSASVLEKLKKRKEVGTDPFLPQFLAVSLFSDPMQEDYPHALYTLSDLDKKEIYSLSMLLAIESILERMLNPPALSHTNGGEYYRRVTVLRAFIDSYLLLKRSHKRRGEKAILRLFTRGKIEVPISLRPVKRILTGGEGGSD